jgi:acetate kinase
MASPPRRVLALNAGSSSLKFALFDTAAPPASLLSGQIERIGLPDTRLTARATGGPAPAALPALELGQAGHPACVAPFFDWLAQHAGGATWIGIGHRIVHGGPRFTAPQRVTPDVSSELARLAPFDPQHLPAEIGWIEAVTARFPAIPQIACFDTAFHRDMPRVARQLPLPRHYAEQGVVRYGFHGLSYEFLLSELERIAGREAARGRVVLAHLGNGASLAAVRDGRSVDTTMGFTPCAGVPMSTRSGDLDPGLVAYLSRTEGMTAAQFHDLVNLQSGLLGISETSSDMRDLLQREAQDPRAAEAVALFCYEVKKRIGAFAAVLGGLDTLVFAGGIGEHAAPVRARVCAGLEFLGITLDPVRNATNTGIVSQTNSRVTVHVLHTDEERRIAAAVIALLAG